MINKEEILAKSRKSGDEMEGVVKDKSMKWTYITMVFVAAIFAFIRSEQGLPMMDLCVTVTASVMVGMIYRFIKTKDKSCLIIGIISMICCIIGIIGYVKGH